MKILVVDDEDLLVKGIRFNLQRRKKGIYLCVLFHGM